MQFEILLNKIKNRITEIDNLLWEMSISDYRDETKLLKELHVLNQMLSVSESIQK